LISFTTAVSALAVKQTDVVVDLKALVSSSSSVDVELKVRRSNYNLPFTAVVFKVQGENDIVVIVCSSNNLLAS
jgi:hypothetical protein